MALLTPMGLKLDILVSKQKLERLHLVQGCKTQTLEGRFVH